MLSTTNPPSFSVRARREKPVMGFFNSPSAAAIGPLVESATVPLRVPAPSDCASAYQDQRKDIKPKIPNRNPTGTLVRSLQRVTFLRLTILRLVAPKITATSQAVDDYLKAILALSGPLRNA